MIDAMTVRSGDLKKKWKEKGFRKTREKNAKGNGEGCSIGERR